MASDFVTDVRMKWQQVPDEKPTPHTREQSFCGKCGKALTVRVLLAKQVVSVEVLKNTRSRCCNALTMTLLDHCDSAHAFDPASLSESEEQSRLRATISRLEATIIHLNGAVANANLRAAQADVKTAEERKKRLAERKAARKAVPPKAAQP